MSDSKDLELFHYGVKGMRWGRRSNSSGSDTSSGPTRKEKRSEKKEARKKNNEDIESARFRIAEKQVALEAQAFKTYTAPTESGRKRATKVYDEMSKTIADSDDAKFAAKLTTGEKWASGVNLTVGIGLLGAAGALALKG